MEDILKSETELFEYISGTRLMERWGLDLVEIRQIEELQKYKERFETDVIDIEEDGTQIYGLVSRGIDTYFLTPANKMEMEEICYKLADIEKFEHEHPEVINSPLTKKEAHELGLLRKEQGKLDMYLQAAIDFGLILNTLQEPITRKSLVDKIKAKYPDITKKAINEHFWQAVPENQRHPGDHIKK